MRVHVCAFIYVCRVCCGCAAAPECRRSIKRVWVFLWSLRHIKEETSDSGQETTRGVIGSYRSFEYDIFNRQQFAFKTSPVLVIKFPISCPSGLCRSSSGTDEIRNRTKILRSNFSCPLLLGTTQSETQTQNPRQTLQNPPKHGGGRSGPSSSPPLSCITPGPM